MKTRPIKGEGDRFLECRYYDDCLDFAGLQNWKNFNCESCDFYRAIFKKTEGKIQIKGMPQNTETKENIRLCKECGDKPTISAGCPYCASCMAIRSHKARIEKKAPVKPKGEKATKDKAEPQKKPQKDLNTALTIEFGKHTSILKEVEKLAEEEVRTIDLQVIYILKRYLNSYQANKST